MVTIREYRRPESLEEAWELNQKKRNRVIAGMLWTKMGRGSIQTAIDLSGLHLNTIEETEMEFEIGCMTTLRQLELHEGLNQYSGGAVREAVRHIVGVQFRNLATVGGSIFGRYGFSDVLTVFLAMDAYVKMYQGGVMSLDEFARMSYNRDILEKLIIKKRPAEYYYQSVRNTKTDFPVLTMAAAKNLETGSYHFSVGARPGRAVLMADETVFGNIGSDQDRVREAVEYMKASIPTGSNTRGSAAYRTQLVGVLTERAVKKLEGEGR
ncbi:MAG: FAD binding domain-containing protein [Clostridiales bacterium]|nr:FAD binding domain-containing protein [Clostridiales bacterium]